MQPILWRPAESSAKSSSIQGLIQELNDELGLKIENYWQLHKWSVENIGEFWSRSWDRCGLIGDKGDHSFTPSDYFPNSKFFAEAKINVAENLLSNGADHEIAIIEVDESDSSREITYGQLRSSVAACAAALRAIGVSPSDRVAAWTPNNSEAAILAIAALSIGAVVSTASPDFAPSAVHDRFGQIEPKFLLACSNYNYNGKSFNCIEKLDEIVAGLPTLKEVVVVHREGRRSSYEDWDGWLANWLGEPLKFERFSFDHPGFVLFSSGTTGKPKCIVHRAAGVLLKLRAEYKYHLELSPKDRTLFYTTCGWMMWNWLIFILGTGSSIVLYDGSPAHPKVDRLFDLASKHQVTALGFSAKYADSLRKAEINLKKEYDLSKIRLIMSTGSVLAPESFDYIYETTKPDMHLVSLSGGTDICGCFIMGIPTLPVHRGEIQGPCLGLAMSVYRQDGSKASANEKGELVCEKPFPSMPIGFWGDDDGSRYRASYFSGFENVWTHGDFAAVTENGGYLMFGRSDATLNSKGVRIGTAEIYRVVENFPEIKEAMAVSQDWDNDSRVILFLVLNGSSTLDDDLKNRIKFSLRNQASPKHVPDLMLAAPELPRTKSNKLVELAVTDLINGREVRNRDALANPSALDWFVNRPELK
ncbi:MAG: acetoacetate--CoA ligase [Actinomycetota bacterium]